MLSETIIGASLFAGLLGVAGCLAGFGFVAMRHMRRLEAGLDSVLDAAHRNGRDIRGFSENVGKVARYSEASVQFQRKVHDHQRVLLTSLNKQMRHLETMLDQPEEAAAIPAREVAAMRTAVSAARTAATRRETRPGQGSEQRVRKAAEPEELKSPIPFHQLFEAASRTAANPAPKTPAAPREKVKIEGSENAVMIARLFKDGKFSGLTSSDALDQVVSEASKAGNAGKQQAAAPKVPPIVATAGDRLAGLQPPGAPAPEPQVQEEMRKVGNG